MRAFRFGRNWESFGATVDEAKVERAVEALGALLRCRTAGRSFLDIGCGSGLSAVAALRLGFSRVEAIDPDPRCVSTARRLLESRFPGGPWRVERRSVFDMGDARHDVVYSWGVLHHTGNVHRALGEACERVAPGGLLAISIYRRTPLCGLWRMEKRLYCHGGREWQALFRFAYLLLLRAVFLARRRDFHRHVRSYAMRGMDFRHDVHDWLGGHPYEPLLPDEVERAVTKRGFELLRLKLGHVAPAGILGSACDEYCFRRVGGS